MISRNKERIEQDEAELAEMVDQSKGTDDGEVQTKPEVKPQVKKEEEQDEVLSKEEESYKKRYGDLRRHMQKKEEEWEARIKELEGGKKNTVAPPKSDEDLDQWISANPDVAGIVALLAKRQAEEFMAGTKDEVENLKKLRQETEKAKAEQTILEVHPDFLKLREADEFHDWLEEQPQWVQDSVYEESAKPKDIIRAIDLYKFDKGLTKTEKKKQEKDAAALVKTPRKAAITEETDSTIFSESQVSRMSAKEYADKEEAITAAIRSGKFKYDLSGGAR